MVNVEMFKEGLLIDVPSCRDTRECSPFTSCAELGGTIASNSCVECITAIKETEVDTSEHGSTAPLTCASIEVGAV